MEQTTEPVEALIGQVERLYQSVTGQKAPPLGGAPYAPMPPEREPEQYLAEQVDRLLGSLAQVGSPAAPAAGPVAMPPLGVWQTHGEAWVICLDVPGAPRETVQVRVLGRGVLEVSGERRGPLADTEARRLYEEWPRGPFRRLVALPPRAATEQIEARLRDGTLEIRVPRAAGSEADARTVPVN